MNIKAKYYMQRILCFVNLNKITRSLNQFSWG